MIDSETVQKIRNLVTSKEDNGWRCESYGEEKNLRAVLIGEKHHAVSIGEEYYDEAEDIEIQNAIVGWIKPGYIVSERDALSKKQQISAMDTNISENACFFGYIGSDEEKQGKIIIECSYVCTRPIAAILGGWHVREKSEIHKTLNEERNVFWQDGIGSFQKFGYICIWNQMDVERFHEKKEKEGES